MISYKSVEPLASYMTVLENEGERTIIVVLWPGVHMMVINLPSIQCSAASNFVFFAFESSLKTPLSYTVEHCGFDKNQNYRGSSKATFHFERSFLMAAITLMAGVIFPLVQKSHRSLVESTPLPICEAAKCKNHQEPSFIGLIYLLRTQEQGCPN